MRVNLLALHLPDAVHSGKIEPPRHHPQPTSSADLRHCPGDLTGELLALLEPICVENMPCSGDLDYGHRCLHPHGQQLQTAWAV